MSMLFAEVLGLATADGHKTSRRPKMEGHESGHDIVVQQQFEPHLLCDGSGVGYTAGEAHNITTTTTTNTPQNNRLPSIWTASWRLKKDDESAGWRVDAASMEKIHGVDVSSFASYKSPKGEWVNSCVRA